MISLFRRRLIAKLMLAGMSSVLILAAVMTAIAVWQSGRFASAVYAQVDQADQQALVNDTQGVYDMVRVQDEAVQNQLKGNLQVARYVLDRAGSVEQGKELVTWSAVNQLTQDTQKIELPRFEVGGEWLGQNSDTGQETPVVDKVQKMVGGAVTVFQRMNEQGDMIRVATTVQTKDGKRAVGTFIPAVNLDGSRNQVIETVMGGKLFQGRAMVVGDYYLAAYEPLQDADGKVVGMLFVGVKQENVQSLRQAIMDIKIGETGYVYVLGGKGDMQGRYIISQQGKRDGENIWEVKDADGKLVIQSIVQKALALKPGEAADEVYSWQNPGEAAPRQKIAHIMYYAPWDWIIAASAYPDELHQYRSSLENGRVQMAWGLVLAAVLLSLLVAGVFGLLARGIVSPIQKLAVSMNALAQGDVEQDLDYHSEDEVGLLAEAYRSLLQYLKLMAGAAGSLAGGNLVVQVEPLSSQDALGNSFFQMVHNLRELISQTVQNVSGLRLSSDHLSKAAEEAGKATSQIAQTVQQVARGSAQQADAINQTTNSVDLMTKAIHGVAKGAQEQSISVSQTSSAMSRLASTADEIRQGANQQAAQMRQAAHAQAEMVTAITSAVQAADQVALETERASESAAAGAMVASRTVSGIQRLQSTTEELGARVHDLGQRSGQIGAIVETIDDIASQTNLLALNAAIEAARAGEHGRGFAVVADEVRKLAERSSRATKEIAEMIRAVQGGANDTVDAMRRAGDDVRTAVDLVNQAGTSFDLIAQGAQTSRQRVEAIHSAMTYIEDAAGLLERAVSEAAHVAERNQEVSEEMTSLMDDVVQKLDAVGAVVEENTASTEEMTAFAGEVSMAIESIASVSQQTSAAIEEVSATTEEMNGQVQSVSISAQALTRMAQDLQQVVNHFKLE